MSDQKKKIGISQRVIYLERIRERRDCLDQKWYEFADYCGIDLFPIPNNINTLSSYFEILKLDGFILSGGNNVGISKGKIVENKDILNNDVAYERDRTESEIIKWAIKHNLSIIGVCRGFQFLNNYFGGELQKIDSEIHVANTHRISFTNNAFGFTKQKDGNIHINSYHDWGISLNSMSKKFEQLALYSDEEVEAAKHLEHNFYGIMWHPERYSKFKTLDKNIFQSVFQIIK